jgi:iron-sulfur cluster repair protein YtfE (RIC family)
MPVQIGAKAHSFSQPTQLLSDCHRRIEMFLGSLERVAEVIDRPLTDEAKSALEAALRYFREAAPKHTADEEESLFPRLRRLDNSELKTALAALDALERDHRRADSLHAEVDSLGRRCLEQGYLLVSDSRRFHEAVADLVSIYGVHIRIEDNVVFPAAGKNLDQAEKTAIAVEMANRRNLAG